jgi:hypothetical protein
MGLDMYIKQCNRTEHNIEQLLDIDNIKNLKPETPEVAPFLPVYKYKYLDAYTIFHEAAYWRKANAVHAWFVRNVQNNVDDCGYYELTPEHLQNLVEVCNKVLDTKDANLLPPQGGFFFGSIDVDDWYWADVKRTIEQVNNILNKDWSKHRFFYHSSW